MNLGENLRALRQSRGMTQQQAAERLNVTRQTVSGYESNRTRPDIDMLRTGFALPVLLQPRSLAVSACRALFSFFRVL